jgi:hypothetical protein
MSGPQTKGLLLVPIAAEIRQFLQEGRISREDVEAELDLPVLKLLDGEISPISWYDGDTYPQLVQLLMKIEGYRPGDLSYVRQRGERAGRRLVESGLYQQLDYMKRRADEQKGAPLDRKLFEQALRLINSVAAAFMKGGVWTLEEDPFCDDRLRFVLTDVDGMSEENAHATWGILIGITTAGGGGFSWLYDRPAPDRILYRMDRDIGEIDF